MGQGSEKPSREIMLELYRMWLEHSQSTVYSTGLVHNLQYTTSQDIRRLQFLIHPFNKLWSMKLQYFHVKIMNIRLLKCTTFLPL